MPHDLTLFGTTHCHLCEQAFAILQDLRVDNAFTVQEIDIAENDALMERYGLRIPVLALSTGANRAAGEAEEAAGAELSWPFDHGDVLRLLRSAEEKP